MKHTRGAFIILFPAIEPYQQFYLQVDEFHELYVETSGNPQGIPVIFLHGGPGAGCHPQQRQFFDPESYHIILFDQRGCGRSKPYGLTHHNTLAHLIADLEAIRHYLQIDKWLVFGGSWGSTLALAYGSAHREACLGFILRGIFLMRQSEVTWFLEGVQRFYPEVWQELADYYQAYNAADILQAMANIYLHGTEAAKRASAYIFTHYEECLSLLNPAKVFNYTPENSFAPGIMQFHYFYYQQQEFQNLLRDVKHIQDLPCIIIQGRYDMVCPPISAYELHQAWPKSELHMLTAGHSAMDPQTKAALVAATEKFKQQFSFKFK